MAHSSSQNFTIHPDLDTRFQALKSKKRPDPKLSKTESATDPEKKQITVGMNEPAVEIDDLFARFSALKTSLPSYSSQSPAAQNQLLQLSTEDDDNEEDEVEKIIRWAKDAARLDPSPPSEDGDDHSDADSDEQLAASKTSKRK